MNNIELKDKLVYLYHSFSFINFYCVILIVCNTSIQNTTLQCLINLIFYGERTLQFLKWETWIFRCLQ